MLFFHFVMNEKSFPGTYTVGCEQEVPNYPPVNYHCNPPILIEKKVVKCSLTEKNVPVSAPASQSCIMTKLPIKLYISNTTTVLHGQKQSWEIIQTRCDQLTGPHGSCQILCCWYTSQPLCSPVSQKSEE